MIVKFITMVNTGLLMLNVDKLIEILDFRFLIASPDRHLGSCADF